MYRFFLKTILLLPFGLFLAGCSGTRHLSKGEKLYTGAEIRLESTETINNRYVKATAHLALQPVPNKTYLWIRPKLWLYAVAGEDPHTKIGKWLKKKGEPPVLMSSVKPGITSAIIDARLFNIGIFKSHTEFKIVESSHTGKLIYTSHVHKPYLVKELIYAISDEGISRIILDGKRKTLIKSREAYNLDNLKNERIRIDALLKNSGYFYFNPDYLLFKADSSNLNRDVTFKLTLKDSIPVNATTVFRIGNVYVNQNYSLDEDALEGFKDTLTVKNNLFFGKVENMTIRPRLLSKSIYLRKQELFSRQNHIITLNRLMSMGNFKLVQINFSETIGLLPGLLDVNILLTPMPKHTFRAEIDLVSKSNNYSGPRMNLNVMNRNTFNGAELLSFNLAGSFEAQLNGMAQNLFSYSWNPQAELTFPRFLVPFGIHETNSLYIPKTRLLLSYNYLKRVGYFDMNTFQFIYGFKWKTDIRSEYELNPIDISYTTIRNKSLEFIKLLNSNPFLEKSYEEQFIAGGSYSYTYNEQAIAGKKIQFFSRIRSEFAGNAFSLLKSISGEKISPNNPSLIAGSAYSQFAKLSFDSRAYYNFISKNILALRFFAGIAKPFGNSSVLPYSKQFFSGGPNSLRAFQINSVGPGTYYQNTNNLAFLQMGGDLKLELNAEYRFTIYRFMKGALFVDSGNVWLLKSNPANTGSPFTLSGFMDQMAVGTGFGLRADLSFFLLRFDLGMPLRKPWLEENHRWVTNQINIGSSSWRKENLVLNIAIGYPF